jgi:DNA processing protein
VTSPAARAWPVRHLRRHAPGWPEALEHLDLPPPALWLRGPSTPAGPAVAVVGARNATVGGLEIARRLGADLAVAGIPVVSGMALGIDGAAHRGAVDAGGVTVAVLGCGIDICYPAAHRSLRDRIIAAGTVLTEEPPGTPPAPWRFPRRNRLIAALALALVVVEATDRSGALSTARHAADLGREVFAVPGSVLSERSGGTNALIRDGATPLTETADLAAVPALQAAIDAARTRFRLVAATFRPRASCISGGAPNPTVHPETAVLLRCLGHDPVHPDALAAQLRLTPAALSARLAELELAGLVRTVTGSLVVRDATPRGFAHTAAQPAPTTPPKAASAAPPEGD